MLNYSVGQRYTKEIESFHVSERQEFLKNGSNLLWQKCGENIPQFTLANV